MPSLNRRRLESSHFLRIPWGRKSHTTRARKVSLLPYFQTPRNPRWLPAGDPQAFLLAAAPPTTAHLNLVPASDHVPWASSVLQAPAARRGAVPEVPGPKEEPPSPGGALLPSRGGDRSRKLALVAAKGPRHPPSGPGSGDQPEPRGHPLSDTREVTSPRTSHPQAETEEHTHFRPEVTASHRDAS